MSLFHPGQKTMRVPKLKNMLIVVIVAVGFYTFFKVNNYIGRFTGEVAKDDRYVSKEGIPYTGGATAQKVTVGGEEYTLYIPDQDTFVFDSESSEQLMNLGNPAENEYVMGIRLMVQDKDLYASPLYKPGEGLDIVHTGACFAPGTYEATLIYEFYHVKTVMLEPMVNVSQTITIISEGSGEMYAEGTSEKKDKKDKNKDKNAETDENADNSNAE